MNSAIRPLIALVLLAAAQQTALSWDYEGHRAINQLALVALPKEFPDFIRNPQTVERIAFLAGEPDRWRNSNENSLHNYNKPEHYFDIEDPEDAGLPLEKLTPFRYDFLAQFDAARRANPKRFPQTSPNKNKDGVRDLCGLLPWAIIENYAKLQSIFSHIKTLQQNKAPAEEIAVACETATLTMGIMGHYVGDATQPLHTSKYHNGWFGPNPNGYTSSRKIHAWIDGGVFARAKFTIDKLRPAARPPQKLPSPVAATPAGTPPLHTAILAWIRLQNKQTEPLYKLEKSGDIPIGGVPTSRGAAFIEEQLLRGGQMLASLWLTAWQNARPEQVAPATARYHRTAAKIALATLPADFPEFTRSRQAAATIDAFVALPARWQNTPILPLRHAAHSETIFNVEDIAAAGLTNDTLTDLRNQHAIRIAQARAQNPQNFAPLASAQNHSQTRQLPGFLPWLIMENYARLSSAVAYLDAYETHGGTPDEIENARQDVISYMGQLAYYVAEATQPLNLTRDKPPSRQAADFSAYLPDSPQHLAGLIEKRRAAKPYLLPRPPARWDSPPRRSPYFSVILTWITRQHEQLPALKKLISENKFSPRQAAAPEARDFIDEQLLRAAEMTARLWQTAFQQAPDDTYLTNELKTRAEK